MKPFDLERAKAGDPVVTRNGRAVRIVCWDAKIVEGDQLVVLITNESNNENLVTLFADGRYYGAGRNCANDLFMAPTKREGWMNIYPAQSSLDARCARGYYIFPTKEQALDQREEAALDTIRVEWED